MGRKKRNGISIRSEPTKNIVIGMLNEQLWGNCLGGYTRFDQHPDIQAVVKIIADLVSTMTIQLMESTQNGDIRVKNQLSRKVDIEPWQYGTRKALIGKIVKEMLISGNSIVIPRYREDLLDSLIPVKFSDCSISNLNENGYSITIRGVNFKHDELLHFVNNPSNEAYKGESYRVYLKDVIKNLDMTQNVKKRFYERDYKPNVIFSFNSDTESFLSPEGRDELYKKFVETKDGLPYMIPAELMKVDSIPSMNLKDLAINESVTLDKKSVASIFNIPVFMLGIGKYDEKEYNNFVNRTIVPIVKELEQELTRKLIFGQDWYFKFNLNSILAFDYKEKMLLTFQAKKLGLLTGNEVRTEMGYSISAETHMNEFTILENFIPAQDVGNQKKLDNGGDKSGGVS